MKNFVKLKEYSYPLGKAGAGMELEVTFSPRNVSFGSVETLELPGKASSVKGYFKKLQQVWKPGSLDHKPSVKWNPIQGWNNKASRADEVHLTEDPSNPTQSLPKPWGKGAFEWRIKNVYRVLGDPGKGAWYTTTVQRFTIDKSGTVTITKGGQIVRRSP